MDYGFVQVEDTTSKKDSGLGSDDSARDDNDELTSQKSKFSLKGFQGFTTGANPELQIKHFKQL